ncbi:hypothetical protein [Deinococcus gobiensis]|uniref:hypothetical protein n=1 Tax=Deinococcus gobiensis TaxID=502394 RepID=UPI0018731F4A|nr:hypothetical protein [Deinococcus gobiensis]
MLLLLPDSRPHEFILDRTNWKLGQQHINVLLLAVVWRDVAVPLLFELLPSRGSSDTQTRLRLLDDALTLLSAAQVRVLYADRGFIGQDWSAGLVARGIPLCIRLRLDTLIDDWRTDDWSVRLKTDCAVARQGNEERLSRYPSAFWWVRPTVEFDSLSADSLMACQ